jgi:hypothetical protein
LFFAPFWPVCWLLECQVEGLQGIPQLGFHFLRYLPFFMKIAADFRVAGFDVP